MFLLLGALGQLGRDLFPLLPEPKLAWSRQDLDLADFEATRRRLREVKPSVVINCAAYNLVDRAESDPDPAFVTNAWAVRNLAQICAELDAVLVQFSTDYVFGLDRERSVPWSETDAPGPVSQYGLSKLTGEYLVRSICPRHFVVRTCGLYGLWGVGGKGGNFVETMLRLAGEGNPISVVNDQFCTPSFTLDVAQATTQLITTRSYGLYHLTNSGSLSWHDFAHEIFRLSNVNPPLAPISSAESTRPAKRPAYSVLALDKLNRHGITTRPWQDALKAYLFLRKQR